MLSGWRFDVRNIKSFVIAAALCAGAELVFAYFTQLPSFTFIITLIVVLLAALNWQDGPHRSWIGLVFAVLAGAVLWLHLLDLPDPLLYGLMFGALSWTLKALLATRSIASYLGTLDERFFVVSEPNNAKFGSVLNVEMATFTPPVQKHIG